MVTMQPQLEQAVVEANQMSRHLEIEKIEAFNNRLIVEKEKTKVDQETEKVQQEYNSALEKLNQTLPALIEAEDALNTLNSSDITELRQTKQPSKGILLTMILTCILLEKR